MSHNDKKTKQKPNSCEDIRLSYEFKSEADLSNVDKLTKFCNEYFKTNSFGIYKNCNAEFATADFSVKDSYTRANIELQQKGKVNHPIICNPTRKY